MKFLAIIFMAVAAHAAHFTNTTSLQLQNLFSNSPAIGPGDTIWIRAVATNYFPPCINPGLTGTNIPGGEYGWIVRIDGATNNPITVRGYPGETVRIDGVWNLGTAAFLRFRDIEFFDSGKGRDPGNPNTAYPARFGLFSNNGSAAYHEWINCIVHDAGNGWDSSAAGEVVRGCVIWHMGVSSLDHVLYNTSRRFSGNIVAYATTDALNITYHPQTLVSSNIFFGTGQALGVEDNGNDISLGTGSLTIIGNRHYNRRGSGTASGGAGYSIFLSNNTVVATVPVSIGPATVVTIADNTFVPQNTNAINYPVLSRSYATGAWVFARNRYFSPVGNVLFNDTNTSRTFAQWQATYPAFDTASTVTNSGVPTNQVHVYPNEDEPKRAIIAIYNWSGDPTVTVDLSSVLSVGDTFTLKSAQNYFGSNVLSGIYTGPVSVPMVSRAVAAPLYSTNQFQGGLHTPVSFTPEFDALVLQGYSVTNKATLRSGDVRSSGRTLVR